MAKGIFTTKINPAYDDIPEIQYHFPQTYLNFAKQMIGDWIIYYEPGRGGGQKAYFATAQVDRISEDRNLPNHYYAYVKNFLELDNPVPFRIGDTFFEKALMRADGSINRGAFQRSIRLIPEDEYKLILQFGFIKPSPDIYQNHDAQISENIPEYIRPTQEQLVSRPFRDAIFSKKVRSAYDFTCAITGLKLINGGGHAEIEAAHIRPVGNDHHGPDSTRNGIALSRTVHWMFDRGILSLSDNYDILKADNHIPDQANGLINSSGKINLPLDPILRPHPQFLRYHRENIFMRYRPLSNYNLSLANGHPNE